MTRRTCTEVHERIRDIVDDIEFVSGDLSTKRSMSSIVADVRPDEFYNLAAQSFVPTSWNQPVLTGEFTALGVTRALEAVRHVDTVDPVLSSLEFGDVRQGRRSAAKRDDAVLSAQSLRRRQSLRALDHGQLSRVVRPVRVQRHAVQSRIAASRHGVRDAQDHRRRRAHQARAGARAAAWAISTRSATGASPAITCARCG